METEKKKVELIYLASPYAHTFESMREARFRAVAAVVAESMGDREKVIVYSPICHNHPIRLLHPLPTKWDFWRELDFPMLEHCDRLMVLQLPGWESSVGVAAEIVHADNRDIPVDYIDGWQDARRVLGL